MQADWPYVYGYRTTSPGSTTIPRASSSSAAMGHHQPDDEAHVDDDRDAGLAGGDRLARLADLTDGGQRAERQKADDEPVERAHAVILHLVARAIVMNTLA